MDMKSLSALRFNFGSALDSFDQDLSRDIKVSSRNSDETNSPDARREANHERDSSSSNYSSPSSSSSSPQHSPPSPPSHALLPPPLLPLASFADPPPLMPLLSSFVPARFGHPGTSFLSFPQPTNGSSFMPFHHPASVLLRQHQAALAYSYVLMNVQQQQQQQQLLRQEKQLNKDRAAIFRPHEVLDHHHQQQQHHHPRMVNSSAERPYYIQSSKVVPFERNDTRFGRKKMVQETSFLSDQLPVDLRKVISPMGDDAARYNNHHHHRHQQHHQQQQQQVLALSTPKKNPTSGKKLIGIRFLFPPFADHVTLYERAKIWVARHEYKYFVDWSADDLLKVDIELRPIHPITRQQYKVHMNRSEFCRNVKLKFCLQTDSPWARDFCEKLQKSPAEGGFTGLCQAKIAAADLWRSYSENYRSHQARQPNGTSLKGNTSVKTSSAKKRLATADESPSKKCARINALTSCNKLASKLSDSDAEQFMDYPKLRNNSYYYYYYRQYNNDVKFQAGRDYMSDHERKPANRERGRNSSPGRCLAQRNDQSERLKISEDEINDVDDDVRTGRLTDKTVNDLVRRKPSSIWTPFGKPSTKHYGDRDVQRDRFVGDPSKKKSDEMKCDSSRFAGEEKLAVDEIATRPDRFSDQQQHQIDLFFQSGSTASGTPFTSKILEEFGKKILNLRADDFLEFRKSTGITGSDINNNNFMLDKCTVDKSCGANKRDDGRCKKSFQSISKSETSRNTAVSSGATNQIEEKSKKSCQNFDYKQVSLDKSRSGRFVEPMNEGDSKSGESLKMGSERRIVLDVFRQDRHSCQNDDPVWASASKVPEDSASSEDEESDGDVDVVDVGDYQAGSNKIEENIIT